MTERTFYVETSVWGMVADGQPREMRTASLNFLRSGCRLLISPVVTEEIELAPEKVRRQIQQILDSLECDTLSVTERCKRLAQQYRDAGIIPAKKVEDALHVAIATVYNIDVLVSWNHKHIVNIRKAEQYRGVNLVSGFSHTPQILTPLEVLDA